MFSKTPPPILDPSEIPRPKSPATLRRELEGLDPNLPDTTDQPRATYNDEHIEEVAVQLMREQLAIARTPASSASTVEQSGHPAETTPSHSPTSPTPLRQLGFGTELGARPEPAKTPPPAFSTRSSVPTGDPTSHADTALAAARLEHDLDGHGKAKGLMRQPEGKGDPDSPEEEEQRTRGGYSDNGSWRRGRDDNGASFR